MRISRSVGMLMVNPVGGNPNYWCTFQAQCGAYHQNIFQPFWHLVAAMREQAMITHADADIDGDDMKHDSDNQR
jgi:hypothetical protein